MKLVLALTILTFQTLALDIESLKRRGYKLYKIKRSDTFDGIAKKLYKNDNRKYQSYKDFKNSLREWNPHLNKVSQTEFTGQYIYTAYPYSANLSYKWAPDLTLRESDLYVHKDEFDKFDAAMGIRNQKSKKRRTPASTSLRKQRSQWFGFVHFTISQGAFTDSIGSSQINSEQNSPLTIGAGVVYLPKNLKDYSIATSLYYSKLTASTINDKTGTISTEEISIPAEIGANIYIQKNFPGRISNIYGGIDYEEFNVFNFSEILSGSATDLENERRKIFYVTAGLGTRFTFYKPVTMKFSFSKGLSSQTELEGNKFMIYYNQKITKSFWYHLLYKQHILSDSSSDRDLTISRYGIGVGTAF